MSREKSRRIDFHNILVSVRAQPSKLVFLLPRTDGQAENINYSALCSRPIYECKELREHFSSCD